MSTQKQDAKRTLPLVFTSYVLICAVWAIYRVFIDKPLTVYFQSSVWIGALVEGLLKTLVLVLPSLILIGILQKELSVPSRRFLAPNWRTLGLGLGVSAAFFLFYSLRNLLTGGVWYSFDLSANDVIGAVFFAAITEEIMYRGFMLNALVQKIGRERANILTAILFSLMHLPLWIADGTTMIGPLLGSLFSTACIGYLLGLVFLHSKSLWGAVMAHALHNLIVLVVKNVAERP